MGLRVVLFLAGLVVTVMVTVHKHLWGALARAFKYLWTKGRLGRSLAACLTVLLGLAYPAFLVVSLKTHRPDDYTNAKEVLPEIGQWLLTKEIGLNVHLSEVVIIVSVALLTYATMTILGTEETNDKPQTPHEMNLL